jgi:hypothetical protein
MPKQDLNESKLELLGVEPFQLALVVWRARLKRRHFCRCWQLLRVKKGKVEALLCTVLLSVSKIFSSRSRLEPQMSKRAAHHVGQSTSTGNFGCGVNSRITAGYS